MPDPVMHLDFETCSQLDLRKVGLFRYVEDVSTTIICAAYAFDDGPVQTWIPDQHFGWPADLLDHLHAARKVVAHNALFEHQMLYRHRLPVAFENLDCTMARAAYWGLPLGLGPAAKAAGVAQYKDEAGRRLMLRMARPRSVKPLRWWHEDDLSKLYRLLEYCVQDVKVERALHHHLPPLPEQEREIFCLDARVNNMGVLLDDELVASMESIAYSELRRLNDNLRYTTAGVLTSVNATGAMLRYLKGLDPFLFKNIDSLAKDRVADLLAGAPINVTSKRVLEIRQEAGKSSLAKLRSMKHYAGRHHRRMRGLTQYYGASRTGRWAGRGPQVQNFPRSSVKDQDGLVAYVKDANSDAQGIERHFGVPALDGLSSILRGCLTVPARLQFAAVDFSQIEARVLAWLANELSVLDAFVQGRDLYTVAAANIYGIAENAVTPEQRQIGKVAVLALGYQGGVGAFQSMAKNYGLRITDDEAETIKVDWRYAHPNIVILWGQVEAAALRAVKHPGSVFSAGDGKLAFRMWRGHLCMKLPSGRVLVYRDAELGCSRFGNTCVTYMGVDQYTRRWQRLDTYGGKLVENATQAVARDVMAAGLLNLDEAGYLIIGSVHDEALLELQPGQSLAAAVTHMTAAPPWCAGLPVVADGYVGQRFRKG